jgi:hypothetical protein
MRTYANDDVTRVASLAPMKRAVSPLELFFDLV